MLCGEMVATEEALLERFAPWAEEVRRLAEARDAVILAHNYQVPWIQDVAHFVGDSLELSRKAAETPAREIVFCGVHFMAETAAILCPDKRVLIPDLDAGCSLAATIDAESLRAWKAEHPGAVVVAYVNTTAEVKAESDICCTSSNAAAVVNSIPADREILFLPDQFLGAHVERVTGRKLHVWMGECHVHAGIGSQELQDLVRSEPDAELLIHPECGCATAALYLAGEGVLPADRTHIVSTGQMIRRGREEQAEGGRFIVATETGILHRLRKENPAAEFTAANEAAVCRYMKTITPAKLIRSLREGVFEVTVPEEVAVRARAAIRRMVEIG
ncbi:MAG: quinolinate synthase NadA [Actinobacteria bacterium]|nr:quinolinate synthase NadA [Actinomycetota bacterium]